MVKERGVGKVGTVIKDVETNKKRIGDSKGKVKI